MEKSRKQWDFVLFAHMKKDNKNIGTVCLVSYNEAYTIGASFCSEKDNFCKKTGRDIAYNRAMVGGGWIIPKKYYEIFNNTSEYLKEVRTKKYTTYRDIFKINASNIYTPNHRIFPQGYPYLAELIGCSPESTTILFVDKDFGYELSYNRRYKKKRNPEFYPEHSFKKLIDILPNV